MVNVSTEVLRDTKKALSEFKIDVEDVSRRIYNYANIVIQECKALISQIKGKASDLEKKIVDMRSEISELELIIAQTTSKYSRIVEKKFEIEKEVCEYRSKISNLNAEVSVLERQLYITGDDELCTKIKNQIAILRSYISQYESKQIESQDDLCKTENAKMILEQKANNLRFNRAKLEEEYVMLKKHRDKINNRLERMCSAYNRVETDLNECISATRKFECCASNNTKKNMNSVEKCLMSIEQYLNTSL